MTQPADLASRLLDRLRDEGLSLATAESLTGGLVGATLTAVPGSSDVYVGGVVSYAITVKTAVLSVPEALIEDHGVVSEECAVAMAEGVRSLTGADLAVATTGVAGPGPQDGVAAGHRLGGRGVGLGPPDQRAHALRRTRRRTPGRLRGGARAGDEFSALGVAGDGK